MRYGIAALLTAALLLGCGETKRDLYAGRGIVRDVSTDERLPRSLTRGIDAVAEELAIIRAGPGPAADALRLARSLAETIRGDWPDRPDLDRRERVLGDLRQACRELHRLIVAAYVDYPVKNWPSN